jgi:hypothetical protein
MSAYLPLFADPMEPQGGSVIAYLFIAFAIIIACLTGGCCTRDDYDGRYYRSQSQDCWQGAPRHVDNQATYRS